LDERANQDFYFKNPGALHETVTRTRSITVNVDSVREGADKIKVNAEVTFKYEYSFDAPDRNNPDIISHYYDTIIEPSAEEPFSYSINPIESYDEEVACFLIYYPFLEVNSAGVIPTENININIDRNNPDSKLKFKLFLVKQVPMILTEEGNYINAIDAGPAGQDILNRDRQYSFAISEFHNSNYQITLDEFGNPTDDMMNVYTNAHRSIADSSQEISSYSYKIKSPHSSGYFYFSRPSLLRNQLVKTNPENRFFDVTIMIYDAGKADDDDATPIFEMEASKLK
jgi:hypothetical protein